MDTTTGNSIGPCLCEGYRTVFDSEQLRRVGCSAKLESSPALQGTNRQKSSLVLSPCPAIGKWRPSLGDCRKELFFGHDDSVQRAEQSRAGGFIDRQSGVAFAVQYVCRPFFDAL